MLSYIVKAFVKSLSRRIFKLKTKIRWFGCIGTEDTTFIVFVFVQRTLTYIQELKDSHLNCQLGLVGVDYKSPEGALKKKNLSHFHFNSRLSACQLKEKAIYFFSSSTFLFFLKKSKRKKEKAQSLLFFLFHSLRMYMCALMMTLLLTSCVRTIQLRKKWKKK